MRTHTKILGLLALTMATGAGAEDYLRASVQLESSANSSFLDRTCEGRQDAVPYFGCVAGDDGRAIGARGDFGHSLGAELAWGRDFNDVWRGEVFVGYQPGFDFDGNANFIRSGLSQPVSGKLDHKRAGVQGFVDLSAVAGTRHWPVTPWIGAAVGVARNRISTMRYGFPELSAQPALTIVPSGSTTNVMWSLSAGVDIELSARHVIELGLSWSDYGDVRTGVGDIEVIRGGDLVAEVAIDQTRAGLEAWGLRIGLRHYWRRH